MDNNKETFAKLLTKVKQIIREPYDKNERLRDICALLRYNVPYYDWIGFYLVDPEQERELILGPFSGEPTEHVRIPFGKGMCGQAAEAKATLVVQDVSKEKNYLSCSPIVKSEIVVPIFKQEEVIAELDIDSHQLSPFTKEDEEFLGEVCERIAAELF